ncbi:hypothetical protein EYZ11_008014 [Aspergillus tanneri]|uniref:Uncharacterized protein n=1 Tax=Aspergillus tanneri TaxID=1220188 RepID=A0A4S3JH52_9EURO|nr:hypothetical protein EYZ11_008014 [Aspergillus tanneri]
MTVALFVGGWWPVSRSVQGPPVNQGSNPPRGTNFRWKA